MKLQKMRLTSFRVWYITIEVNLYNEIGLYGRGWPQQWKIWLLGIVTLLVLDTRGGEILNIYAYVFEYFVIFFWINELTSLSETVQY